MVIELKKGFSIDSWYDKFTDSYITRLLDPEGNQIRDALYSGDIVGRNYDIQSIKDFFTTYMKDPNFNIEQIKDYEDEDSIDEQPVEDEFSEIVSDEEIQNEIDDSLGESLDSELDKRAKKTKRATRKAKLPALSKMTPIMPDYESGISKFNAATADGNSGMASTTGSTGLGEAYIGRNELIKSLKDMGFKYKFDKYSDKQLFRIYQERKSKLEKQKVEKEKKEIEDAYKNNKEENAKDSYFKDEIEFESEDAAREYFGESMSVEKYNIKDIDVVFDFVYEANPGDKLIIKQKSRHNASGIQTYERKDKYTWLQGGFNIGNNELYRWLNNSLIPSAEIIIERDSGINESMEMNDKFYLNDMHEAWDIVEDDISQPLKEDLNKGHNFNTITEGLHYFERKAFDESYKDLELESLFESMRDKLSSEDIKKLGAFMNHAEDSEEVLTYMKGLLSEDFDEYDPDEAQDKRALSMIAFPLNNAIIREADSKGLWVEENGINTYAKDNAVELFYWVDGDWKHDHLRFDNIVARVIEDNGYRLINSRTEDQEDDGSDDYRANHVFTVDVSSARTPKNESLSAAEERDVEDMMSAIRDRAKKASIEVYRSLIGASDQSLYFLIAGLEENDANYFDNIVTDMAKNFGYLAIRQFCEPDEDYGEDTEIGYKLEKRFKNESLNEAYVEEWWGQTEEDPREFAKEYNLSVKALKKNMDEVLYRFEGAKKDLDRAQHQGYFFNSEIKTDADNDIDAATKELIERLEDVGFILDESVTPVKDSLFGGKHLQVINPNLYFPTAETEGEEITDEEAYALFRDDIREVEGVLDKFEDEVEGSFFLTFNFGANDKMQITGGIDLRPAR